MPDCEEPGCRFSRAGGPAGCNSVKPYRCSVCRDASAFSSLDPRQKAALWGVVRRVANKGDATLIDLLWGRLAHSPLLVTEFKERINPTPRDAPSLKRKGSDIEKDDGSSSSSDDSSDNSSESSAKGEAPPQQAMTSAVGASIQPNSDTTATIDATAAEPDAAAKVADVAPASVASVPPDRKHVRHHAVHQLVGVVLDQAKSPWCTEHAMAMAASSSLYGKYGFVLPATDLLKIWLQMRVPTQQWPCDFCKTLQPFTFRHGEGVYTCIASARLVSDMAMALQHVRRSAGYWHIVIVCRASGYHTHSMVAIRMTHSGKIDCANSHGTRQVKVPVAPDTFVCSYVVSCEVVKATAAMTGDVLPVPRADADWERLMYLS